MRIGGRDHQGVRAAKLGVWGSITPTNTRVSTLSFSFSFLSLLLSYFLAGSRGPLVMGLLHNAFVLRYFGESFEGDVSTIDRGFLL